MTSPPDPRPPNIEVERPEIALLLACSHTQPDSEAAERIHALATPDLDWAAVIREASRHKVWPLLYRSLASIAPDTIPQSVIERLRREYMANALRNLVLARELLRILRALDAEGIIALPYKGPVLAESVYGDLSLRQFTDLDILVHREDVPSAMKALAEIGYQSQDGGGTAERYLHSMHHHSLRNPENNAFLELHWAVAERYFAFRLEPETLWARRGTARLIRQEVPSLGGEDLLLVLCVHASKHGWEQLGMVCDVAELVRALPGLDWQTALQQARDCGGERMMLLGLLLAHNLLGTSLPDVVQRRLAADVATRRIETDVRTGLFGETQTDARTSERVRHFRLHLRVRERFRDRAACLLHLAFTPSQEDWEAVPLPPRLAFLHYPLRPIRVGAKYLAGLPSRLVRRGN